MQNKPLIITNIIILCCIIVGLIIFLIWGIGSKHEYFLSKNTIIDNKSYNQNQLNNININVKSYDISFKKSSTSDLKIEVYGRAKDKNKLNIALQNGELKVTQNSSSTFFCIGFCSFDNKVIIYLPEDFNIPLNIKTMSGDITSSISLNNLQNKFKTTSGDIELTNLTKSEVVSTSGNIDIKYANELTTKTTSGDINISKVNKLNAASTSGEIEVNELNGFCNIKTTSGDINIDYFTLENHSSIESTSGEVEVRLFNDANISAHTLSGDKKIKNSNGSNNFQIKTTSGDITIK